MLKGVSLQELAQKLEADRPLKKDLVADTREIRVLPKEKSLVLAVQNEEFPIQPLAHTQIAGRTDIPGHFYNRILREAPDLVATNVNRMFDLHPERRMVRTLRGSTRAFLSDRFQRIENFEVANVILAATVELKKHGIDATVVSCDVTERKLYIHVVFPGIQGDVKVGDPVQAGFIASNSEVGLGAVVVEGLLWRLWCLNGMKTKEAFRRHHVGRRIEETGDVTWGEDTLRSDDTTVLLKVRDMIKAVSDETLFKANLIKLQDFAGVKVTGDPAKAIEVLAQKIDVSEGEQGGILRSLIEGGDLSAWGLMNAVTAQAHTAPDYDRAVEFEGAGGKLLNLPKAEWKEILEAGELRKAA